MKSSVLAVIWRTKSDFALLLALVAVGWCLAPHAWEKGLLAGLAIGALLALFGRAVRRARFGR